jgi:general nucleoside transport system permease protein
MRFERRTSIPPALLVVAPLGAVGAALLLSGFLVAIAGAPVLEAYRRILIGAFGSRLAISETLTRATPLIFTGLAAATAFRARLWNIGAEGQFYVGALAAVTIGSGEGLHLPAPVLIPLLMCVGAGAGMLLLLAPLGLRLRFGVDEVVTTLLLNFVVLLFVSMMIEGPLRDPLAFGWPQSVHVNAAAVLPKLITGTRLHIGLLIALALSIIIWVIQGRSVFGLEARAVGLNPRAAAFAGVSLPHILIRTACLSGGLAGLAGAIEVLGVKTYVTTDLSPGFGYAGIVVAVLAQLNPIGVVGAALFAATMFVGVDGMSRALHVPSFLADVTVSLSLLLMLVGLFLATYRVRP